MRRRRLTVGTIAAVALLTVATSGCQAHDLPLPGHPVEVDRSIDVSVEFDDVLNLAPRSAVMVNDVTVGEVTDLKADGWGAVATLRVQDDVELPANTIAAIRQTSMLGEKYVSLDTPTGETPQGRLADGMVIPLSRSGRNPELEEVLSALGFLLSGGGVGRLKVITTEVNDALDGRQAEARAVLNDLAELMTSLDDQRHQIIGAMESMNSLAGTLDKEKDIIDGALATLGPAIETLSTQHQQLVTLLRSLDKLSTVGTQVINEVGDELLADLESLQPTLHEINRVGTDLADAIGTMLTWPFMYDGDPVAHGDYGNVAAVLSVDLDLALRSAGVDTIEELVALPGFKGLELEGLGPLLGLAADAPSKKGVR